MSYDANDVLIAYKGGKFRCIIGGVGLPQEFDTKNDLVKYLDNHGMDGIKVLEKFGLLGKGAKE